MNAATAIQIDTPAIKEFRSERQRRMYEFILRFRSETGFSPTIREIGENTDIPSTSVVNYNLKQMIADGWLRHAGYGKSRGFIPCEDAPQPMLQLLPQPGEAKRKAQVASIIHEARRVLNRLESERYYCTETISLLQAIREYEKQA